MRTKSTEHKYSVVTGSGRRKVITCKNVGEAYEKAKRIFPRARTVVVSRQQARTGKGYESYIISRPLPRKPVA